MDADQTIRLTTVLLALTAGYCDTVTFVAADQLFSAHVTGNFIVLAYDIVKHVDSETWVKLLTFPVFIIAVMGGGLLTARTSNKYQLLLAEGFVLVSAGLLSLIINAYGFSGLGWQNYLAAMIIVFAMGLQNAFGKLFAKETIGPTTMMTGNVTQAALDLGILVYSRFKNDVSYISLRKQLITICGFLIGCIAGGFIGQSLGLSAVLFPGLAVLGFAIFCYRSVASPN